MSKLLRSLAAVGMALAMCSYAVAQDAPSTPQLALPGAHKKPMTGTPHLALPPQQTTTSIPEDQQPSKEQVAELMDVMQVQDQVDSMMSMLPAMMEHQMHAQISAYVAALPGGKSLTPEQQTKIEKLTQKYIEKAVNIYPQTEMVADLSVRYQHHLNNGDVESLISFFGSDAGQHYLEVQPAIMKEYLPTVTERIAGRSKDLNSELKKELEQTLSGGAKK